MWQLGQRMEFIHFVYYKALVTTWITFREQLNRERKASKIVSNVARAYCSQTYQNSRTLWTQSAETSP